MKTIKIGTLKVLLCEHKGDITYERFVKFKQYAPQFWEKMDSPLFESYWEKILDHFNKSEFQQAFLKLRDYKLAIDNTKDSYDAWGVCFALITEVDKEKFKECPNDAEIKEKIELFNKEGLKAETVNKSVLDFMQASPETFQDHLIHHASLLMTSEVIGVKG
jgi:hypothetical protein